jgi:hypothetical protein
MKNFIMYSFGDELIKMEDFGKATNIKQYEKKMRKNYQNLFDDIAICLYILETKSMAKPLKMNWEE